MATCSTITWRSPPRVRRLAPVPECLPLGTVRTNASIHTLPDDIMLLIISFVTVKDILSLRKTSKRLHALSKLRWVWQDAMKRHVIDKGLPIPAAESDLKAYSSEQLEARAVHAATFDENWCSPQPRHRQSIEFQAYRCLPDEEEQHKAAVNQVFFLPGSSGELLVTVVGRVITCWEVPLDGSGTYRMAEWVSSKPVDQLIINEDPTHEAVLAFVSGEPTAHGVVEIWALALDKFHGCFRACAKLKGYRDAILPLHIMHGDYVVFGDPLLAWFYSTPAEVKNLGRFQSSLIQDEQSNKILTVRIIHRYMLIIRERSFALDFAPCWKGQRTVYNCTKTADIHVAHPATEAVVIVRKTAINSEEQPDWPTEPVTILTRCSGDGLDTLHQFDLLPLGKVSAEEAGDAEGQQCGVPRFPCAFPSQCTRVVVVAPSCRDLCISPSGKGFWIQTGNVTSRHSVYPARCVVGFQVTPNAEGTSTLANVDTKDTRSAMAKLGNGLQICSSSLYSRRCDMSEILWKKYSVVSAALEDTVGRIAIGDRVGKVEVLDYA